MIALSAGLLASVMLLQPAAATFNWGAAKPFNNPNNNNNICTDQQKGGFDWNNLPQGNFNKFGDFDFSGFSCKDSFSGRKGRRALEARNGFQQKVIEGRCTADKSSAPKISCGTDKNFSIKDMQITVEFDTDIDFEYTMADGSSCKQTQRCSAGGSTISNRQCGGARSVTFKRPKNGKDCNIGIHKVDFDCDGPAPPPPPPPPSTSSSTTQATTSTTQATTVSTKSSSTSSTTKTTSQISSACTSCSKSTTTSPTTVSTSAPSSSSSSSSLTSSTTSASSETSSAPDTSKIFTTLPPFANTTTSQSTESQTSSTDVPQTLTSQTSELPNTLTTTTAPETATTTSEQVTTELTFVTLTTCDVTLTQTTDNLTITQTTQTLSTTTLTSTVTFCPKCGETVPTEPGLPPSPPSSTSEVLPPPPATSTESTTSAPSTLETSTVQSSTSAVPPPPPPPPADTPQSPCPETLPRCMNTWLSLAKCTSNSDASCMCPNAEFTKNVISCVTAWGASDQEVQAALSYFAGICAKFVPENPGICTDVPTSITLIPTITPITPATPPSGTAPPAVNPEGPQGSKPAEVPCTTITLVNTVTATADGAVQTTTQFITVPQVTFVTGEPVSAPAATAPAENGSPAPAPQPSIGLVPMPQPVQAGPTTPAAGGSSTTAVVAASSSSNPIASVTTGSSNPQVSQFQGVAASVVVRKGAVGIAGALAVVAFAL